MVSETRAFRIAVIGGGIGGLCATLSLHHHCKQLNVDINVYEQAAQYKEIGAGIGIGVNAAKLLHKLEFGEEVNKIAGHRNGVWISFRRYDTGADIITVPADDTKTIRQLPVHRAEFLDLLVRVIKERNAATLHTNKACQKVIDNGSDVTIQFKDGTSASADLVVGCDGIHSVLRSQFYTDNPRYSGRTCYRGLVPISQLESWWPLKTYSASWLGPDRHLLVFPISDNKTLNIVAFVATPESELGGLKESWTATGDRNDTLKAFEDFDETVRKVIGSMPERPSKWVLNDREPLDQWVFAGGKVVLMGDAAHAMLPHQGAGAGQAIEDGYILARAVQDHLRAVRSSSNGHAYGHSGDGKDDGASLQRYMGLYQSVRLPRAQQAQATARQAGEVYEMQRPDMVGKSYDDCLPLVRDALKDRMKWVWTADIDDAYEKARAAVISGHSGIGDDYSGTVAS
ncbi:FAD/NAD(P)-binding domain-containing protein [Rhizodiscina lignyota]|uniref:FAD/NAD(P)-binding domain-containing protein n=1 Tax=Rhizodiscina lignyota TaxID=1504668 RepID=A0A9P4M4P7_9PEZI|nr:FAD/NAD(P)-binding domain-containing protein [Rhizodiscina lignyota]